MQTFIWIIWVLLPLFFLLTFVFSVLEKKFGAKRGENLEDLLSQIIFLTICSALSFAIDFYLLDSITANYPSVPRWCSQAVLMPVLMLIGARLTGGSKSIRVLPKSMKKG